MSQLKSIMSTNSQTRIVAMIVLVCTALLATGCKQDPIDPSSQRTRLGTISVAVVATSGIVAEAEFRGRVISLEPRDTSYTIAPGTFKHLVELRDTLTNRTLKIYFTLPQNAKVKTDTTMRLVCVYKQSGDRSALLLKTKNDSLVCLVGTLPLTELDPVLAKGGEQVRVAQFGVWTRRRLQHDVLLRNGFR
jgi:hypothetical protein